MSLAVTIIDKYNGYRGPEDVQTILSYKEVRSMIAAAKHPGFILARFKLIVGMERVLVYARDHSSPSGKILVGGGPVAIMDRLIRKYQRTSALSPTENLTAPSRGIF